jgi:hypothetical protein
MPIILPLDLARTIPRAFARCLHLPLPNHLPVRLDMPVGINLRRLSLLLYMRIHVLVRGMALRGVRL